MKVYVIESKNGIMMSVGVSVKNQMIVGLVKMIICGILVHLIKINKYLDIKNCSYEKLLGKLVLAYEGDILSKTASLLVI